MIIPFASSFMKFVYYTAARPFTDLKAAVTITLSYVSMILLRSAQSEETMYKFFDLIDGFGETVITWADPELKFTGYTKGWPLTRLSTAFTIAVAYVGFVLIGSLIMKVGVPAIDPYPMKFVYNLSQIFLCSYMTLESILLAYRNGYHIRPGNLYKRDEPVMADLLWFFYASKLWDFWDTVFLVLGKKWRQLSFLHCYHHFSTFLFNWFLMNSLYDGEVYLGILLNGFIHTVMYTYYFICMHTKDPKTGFSLDIWWKRYLTIMQMIQFIIMMSQASFLIVSRSDAVSNKIMILYLVFVATLLILFAEFYFASYETPRNRAKGVYSK